MRIFLAIPGSPNPAFPSGLWRANLHDPLAEMGHDVVLFEEGVQPLFDLDPRARATHEARARFTERFLATVEAANDRRPLDLVVTYLSDNHIEPDAVTRVRERTAPIVNFYCNNVEQFDRVSRISPRFDLCLVPEREALSHYRRVGAEALFWPMAANPRTYRPLDLPPEYDATFAGQRYGERTTLMLALLEAGVDAHVFGQSWEPERLMLAWSAEAKGPLAAAGKLARDTLRGRWPWVALADRRSWRRLRTRYPGALHGPLRDEEYVALFSRSRISLGFLTVGDTHRDLRPLRQLRLREFEAPMAAAFYLTGWLPELADLYEIGREIECYRSRAELIDKCRFYLARDDARERIRRAGHERARRDHTWTRRYEALFAELARRGLVRARTVSA